jgi:hypothetical protein
MIFKNFTALALRLAGQTDAPERPLIVASTCQSEIKRTLRRSGQPRNTVDSRGFDGRQPADLTRMVNVGFPKSTLYGFERVDTRRTSVFLRKAAINRKFTPNPFVRIFRKFSAI